jgi:hypothetical protein
LLDSLRPPHTCGAFAPRSARPLRGVPTRRCRRAFVTVQPAEANSSPPCPRARQVPPASLVPPSWSLTTSTVFSARPLQVCCTLLPTLGFAAFPPASSPSTRRSRSTLRSVLATLRPFKGFPSPRAVPRHRGRCPPAVPPAARFPSEDVPLRRRAPTSRLCSPDESVSSTPVAGDGALVPSMGLTLNQAARLHQLPKALTRCARRTRRLSATPLRRTGRPGNELYEPPLNRSPEGSRGDLSPAPRPPPKRLTVARSPVSRRTWRRPETKRPKAVR